jgi:hypothetical protein
MPLSESECAPTASSAAYAQPRRGLPRKVVLPLLAIWVLAIVVGLAIAIDHEMRPSARGAAGAAWPAGAHLERATAGSTLVMFVHPECPCTAASLEQLESLLASCEEAERPLTHVVVVGQSPQETSSNATRAAQIVGARLSFDLDGSESRRFGSHTSGTVLIYGADGKLTFCGGITAGRGHRGENLAADAARLAATGEPSKAVQMPVFGCSLRGDE